MILKIFYEIDECLNKVEIGRKNKIYNDLLPIIRLKIEYIGYFMVRTIQLLRKYSDKISNVNDVIQFWKKTDIFNSEKRNNDLNDIDLENHILILKMKNLLIHMKNKENLLLKISN